MRTIDSNWHKTYIALQSLLGALKVAVRASDKKLGALSLTQLIEHMESYVETWKQFNHYVGVARSKNVDEDDEVHFLEIKSVIAQELELLSASIDFTSPSRDEIHKILIAVPSLQALCDQGDGPIKNIEMQWHKIFIGIQALLGQLKVQAQKAPEKKKGWSLFGRK